MRCRQKTECSTHRDIETSRTPAWAENHHLKTLYPWVILWDGRFLATSGGGSMRLVIDGWHTSQTQLPVNRRPRLQHERAPDIFGRLIRRRPWHAGMWELDHVRNFGRWGPVLPRANTCIQWQVAHFWYLHSNMQKGLAPSLIPWLYYFTYGVSSNSCMRLRRSRQHHPGRGVHWAAKPSTSSSLGRLRCFLF